MKPVVFVVALGIGFVLGARAGRGRYEQIKRTASRVAESDVVKAGVGGAQRLLDDAAPRIQQGVRTFTEQATQTSKRVAEQVGERAQTIVGQVSESAADLQARVSTQAEDLQSRATHTADELRRRSEEQLAEMRRRVDEELEAQAESLVRAGVAREEALVTLEDEADVMVGEPVHDTADADAVTETDAAAEPGDDAEPAAK